jgi:hypothetical protein
MPGFNLPPPATFHSPLRTRPPAQLADDLPSAEAVRRVIGSGGLWFWLLQPSTLQPSTPQLADDLPSAEAVRRQLVDEAWALLRDAGAGAGPANGGGGAGAAVPSAAVAPAGPVAAGTEGEGAPPPAAAAAAPLLLAAAATAAVRELPWPFKYQPRRADQVRVSGWGTPGGSLWN